MKKLLSLFLILTTLISVSCGPGRDGLNGYHGQDGIHGTNGTNGGKGEKGETGETGETGEDASMVMRIVESIMDGDYKLRWVGSNVKRVSRFGCNISRPNGKIDAFFWREGGRLYTTDMSGFQLSLGGLNDHTNYNRVKNHLNRYKNFIRPVPHGERRNCRTLQDLSWSVAVYRDVNGNYYFR